MPKMQRRDGTEFEARCRECDPATRKVLLFLRQVAEHAGSGVEPPTYEVRGVGVTYWSEGKRFCRFDPKHKAGHVWAMLPGANRDALSRAGAVSDREDGPWVTVRDMVGAVRLAPEILRSYDDVASREKAHREREEAIDLIYGRGAGEDFDFCRRHNSAILRYAHGIMSMQGAPLSAIEQLAADPRSAHGWLDLLEEHPEDLAILREFFCRVINRHRPPR